GQLPFNPASPVELWQLQKAGVKTLPKDLRPDLPAGAQEVILKALSFDQENRHERICDFGKELADSLRAETTATERAGPKPAYDEVTIQTLPPTEISDFLSHNLPVQPTPFIDRPTEISKASDLLHQADVRLLTFVGPGGTGKTRLSLEVAD